MLPLDNVLQAITVLVLMTPLDPLPSFVLRVTFVQKAPMSLRGALLAITRMKLAKHDASCVQLAISAITHLSQLFFTTIPSVLGDIIVQMGPDTVLNFLAVLEHSITILV
jgi:hypothetical protein